jgi:V/A-type H+-transporting ATPase subunit I
MVRLAVWGLLNERSEIINNLHELGVMHLEAPHQAELSNEQIDSLRLLRGKLLGILEALEWDDWKLLDDAVVDKARNSLDLPLDDVIREVDRSLDKFKGRITQIREENDSLRELNLKLHQTHDVIHHFQSFLNDEEKKGMETFLWWISRPALSRILSDLRKEIRRITPVKEREYLAYHTFQVREKESLVSLSVNPDVKDVVTKVMMESGCVKWHPPADFERDTAIDSVSAVEEGLIWIPERLEAITKDLQQAHDQWGPKFAALYILVDEKLEQLLVEHSTDEKGNLFLIEGWIPSDKLDYTVSSLRERFGNNVFYRWRYPSTEEWHEVPTSLSNLSVFRPFEIFLKLLQAPSYKTLDPTAFIAIFFPFFSGCMVGDLGYAMLISVLGIWMKRKKSSQLISDLGYVILSVGVWSGIWGVAFGEFFGDVGHRLFHMSPLWVERSHAVMPVMIFTISLGAAHVMLGLLLGIYQGLKSRQHHLWMEKAGNLIIIIALFSFLVILKGWLPDQFFTIAISAVIVGFLLLMIGGGMGGLVEAMGSIGNILSYVRIAAIGLSSAILAVVASKFVDVFGLSLLGLFLALSIHILNFILALGGSSLHSARLHYVEFMGKFYSGSGTYYKPFSKRRRSRWKKQ